MYHFTVEIAKYKHINTVCRINETVFGSTKLADIRRNIFIEIIEDIEQVILIAKNGNNFAGYIHARHQKDLSNGYYVDIAEIAMTPYYQNHGGGTKLVLGVEQWSRQTLYNLLKCRFHNDNIAMKALLEGCGYSNNGYGEFEKTIV